MHKASAKISEHFKPNAGLDKKILLKFAGRLKP